MGVINIRNFFLFDSAWCIGIRIDFSVKGMRTEKRVDRLWPFLSLSLRGVLV
jgi:hypothetical protein